MKMIRLQIYFGMTLIVSGVSLHSGLAIGVIAAGACFIVAGGARWCEVVK